MVLGSPYRDESIPGPGTYPVPGEVGKHALKYSIRPKTSNGKMKK